MAVNRSYEGISVVIPAKNEAASLRILLPELNSALPGAEVIVVNDGSTDDTPVVCESAGIKTISHVYSKGNGAAIKSGASHATRDVIVFMDADGQHSAEDVKVLLGDMGPDVDMVVGARTRDSHAGTLRMLANTIYNRLSSWIVGHRIHDLTSGFRAVRRDKFVQFLYLLPNGFSYPTTSTMAFFKMGYTVLYRTVDVKSRIGKSHISPIKDGVRFFLIIFKIATLYSPLKLFFPSSVIFMLLGLSNYLYTYINYHTFTNMSGVLMISSIMIFLMGLVAEQLTTLLYSRLGE